MMADLYTKTVRLYDEMLSKKDPRVDDWFMMSSPFPSILICIAYFILVRLGTKIMENRKPFELRQVLIVYNLGMVVLSTYSFVEFNLSGWTAGYTLKCQLVDYSNAPQAMRMANVCWVFYISKFIELFDTMFFIMRKKFNQVSFLHVFHHGIMPASWWIAVRFAPGGFGTFHSMLNSFIHLMMYTYYGLAGLGPKYQKYLWWKKYMTKMQMTQFVLVTIHTSQLFFLQDCSYPKFFAICILTYALMFLFLFVHFYIQTYKKATHVVQGKESNGVVTNNEEHKKQN